MPDKPLRRGAGAVPVMDRSVYKRFPPQVLSAAEQYTASDGSDDWVLTAVPSLPGRVRCGMRAVRAAAAGLLSEGCMPAVFRPVFLMPEGAAESALRELSDEVGRACLEEGMRFEGAHLEVTGAVSIPVTVGAAMGRRLPEQAGRAPEKTGEGRARGRAVVMTGYAAAEAAWLIALERPEEMEKRFPLSFAARCRRMGEALSVRKAALCGWDSGCETMVSAGAGGVYAALWELSARCGRGLRIETDKVPVLQEGIEIAEFYDFDPFAAASGGCLFMVTGDPEKMLAGLSREGIPASVIGSTDDTKACRLVHGEETRYLDLPPADAVLKVLERQS